MNSAKMEYLYAKFFIFYYKKKQGASAGVIRKENKTHLPQETGFIFTYVLSSDRRMRR